jgi:hypothetical protein
MRETADRPSVGWGMGDRPYLIMELSRNLRLPFLNTKIITLCYLEGFFVL